ncbi:MAG: DUF3536 domain-containing protein [Cytophagales bacterium]|nr:DUF3536 domain-containing protein [Cytophagales bacterium]
MEKYICIHGHFYQPPRENAWLEEVELQDSAYPFHDWNERITHECYGPNSASRILDKSDVIKNIQNNYSKISFNFGPTLLSWLELHDHETYEAIVEADKISLQHFDGHGSALAQVYNHIIMPLANRRDKETQVKWGVYDFEKRFGRKPEGMWLAETAVDTESLEVLAENGIKYTVLAPRQAQAVRKIGEEEWRDVSDLSVNTRVPYLFNLPSGGSIYLYFYDGDISQAVAFNGLLNDGQRFANDLIKGLNHEQKDAELVHIATDGESYGHHHKHGDMALAFCLDYIEKSKKAKLTNYGEFLAKFEVQYEAKIVEDSSWSCVHGVGRWKEDCGCHTGGHPDWNQRWRKPLRESLDWLRDRLEVIYEEEGKKIFKDPWQARDEYIKVILDREEANVDAFLNATLKDMQHNTKALRLLEMQRHALLMYTSCGWFFDEVSGIETTQILQYACRAIQLASQEGGIDLEYEFLALLSEAKSNMPGLDHAANVYMKYVVPARVNLARVGMHYSVSSIFVEDPESFPVFNHTTINDFFERKEAGIQRLAVGVSRIRSNVTRSEKKFSFAVLYLGQQNIIGNISLDMSRDKFDEMYGMLTHAFDESNLGEIFSIMQKYFGPEKYNLWHLFKDQKRKVLKGIMDRSLGQVEASFRRIYNRDYQLINTLKNDDIPLPSAYTTTLQYVLNADLVATLNEDHIDMEELERIRGEFEKWDVKFDHSLSLEQHAAKTVFKALERISSDKGNVERIDRLNSFLETLEYFELRPSLYKSQNLYYEISINQKDCGLDNAEWYKSFERLGNHLRVKAY